MLPCESDARLFLIFSDSRVTAASWAVFKYREERPRADCPQGAKSRRPVARATGSGSRPTVPAKGWSAECSLFSLVAESRRAEIGCTLGFDVRGATDTQTKPPVCRLLEFTASRDSRSTESKPTLIPATGRRRKAWARLGFKEEGRLRERWIVDGEVSDAYLRTMGSCRASGARRGALARAPEGGLIER